MGKRGPAQLTVQGTTHRRPKCQEMISLKQLDGWPPIAELPPYLRRGGVAHLAERELQARKPRRPRRKPSEPPARWTHVHPPRR